MSHFIPIDVAYLGSNAVADKPITRRSVFKNPRTVKCLGAFLQKQFIQDSDYIVKIHSTLIDWHKRIWSHSLAERVRHECSGIAVSTQPNSNSLGSSRVGLKCRRWLRSLNGTPDFIKLNITGTGALKRPCSRGRCFPPSYLPQRPEIGDAMSSATVSPSKVSTIHSETAG